MKICEIQLDGKFTRLEPMRRKHFEQLCEIGFDESLWRWMTNVCLTETAMKNYVETALDEFERKVSLPFVTIDKSKNKIVGSTRFGNIDGKNRKTEIGWTWINPAWQRTFINTEAKFLMLRHAFDVWKCVRVEFKTDVLNEKSRNAILRIGAKEEGLLRNHFITDSGRLRDTVYFSIIENEWKKVEQDLQNKLGYYQ